MGDPMRSTLPSVLVTTSACLLLLAPVRGLAQTPKDTAQAIARTAEVFAAEGKTDEAITLFLKAYGLDPAPLLLYNVGRLYDKKGDLARARDYYERYVAQEQEPERLAKGQQRLAAVLDRFTGRLVIETDPASASVEVDGKPVKALRQPLSIELKPGSHEVVARLDKYGTERQTVSVTPGGDTRIRLKMRALSGELTVRCDVRGARVSVQGHDSKTTPFDRPFVLPAGHHIVEVLADGYWKSVQSVDVPSSGSVAIDVALTPLPAPVALPPAAPTRGPVERQGTQAPVGVAGEAPTRHSPWQWVALGSGAAMVITGGILTALAMKDRSQVTDAATWANGTIKGTDVTRATAQSLEDSANRKMDASIAMYALGGAAIVTGIILWATEPALPAAQNSAQGPGETRATASLTGGPWDGGGMVAVTGSF